MSWIVDWPTYYLAYFQGEARNFHAYSKSPTDKEDASSPEKSQNGSSSEEGKRRPGG